MVRWGIFGVWCSIISGTYVAHGVNSLDRLYFLHIRKEGQARGRLPLPVAPWKNSMEVTQLREECDQAGWA